VKTACEVCGASLRSGPNKVEIDGAIMIVCNNCAKLGKAVGGPLVRDGHPHPISQPAFRPMQGRSISSRPTSSRATEPEYELDQDYNVKIRQAREKLGLSQEALGKMINEKLSVIRMVESKKLKPDAVLTSKLMHHLKINILVSLSELEGGSSGM
jgi:putative transcription factor